MNVQRAGRAPRHEAASERIPNPAGTQGFALVEFADRDPGRLTALFRGMGFAAVGRHRRMDLTLFRQGQVSFLLNFERSGFAAEFFDRHGPSVCGFGFRVGDAAHAIRHAVAEGAVAGRPTEGSLNAPFVQGIGGSRLYLVDALGWADIEAGFEPQEAAGSRTGAGITLIDHLTHNVQRGEMDRWASFYETAFNFRQIRFFDIEGRLTGLRSRAMTSPCRAIRIPINESADDKSQIAEYLEAYKGEGVQHVALATNDIYATVQTMRDAGIPFMDPPPDTYYEALHDRVPGHGEDIERLRRQGILVDGESKEGTGILLQIFTRTVIGPIFFEIIQRKGNEGFGEGNFRALFEAMERDQIRRGVLSDPGEAA